MRLSPSSQNRVAAQIANDIARDIGRRGWPAEVKAAVVRSPLGDDTRWVVIVPSRGVAVVNDDLRITVASSNRPAAPTFSFNHTDTEADAEQTIRNLPLP